MDGQSAEIQPVERAALADRQLSRRPALGQRRAEADEPAFGPAERLAGDHLQCGRFGHV
jgi:hypothetical protein